LSEQPSALFRRQPVPEADADPSDPSHAPDARSQFGTQQTGISRTADLDAMKRGLFE